MNDSNYDWYVYVPKFVCENCVIDLCRILKENGIIDKVAFIIPYDIDYGTIITEAGIPLNNIRFLKGSIGIPAEKENLLFIFTLSSNLMIKSIYVPDRKFNNLTNIYINVIKLRNSGQQTIRINKTIN